MRTHRLLAICGSAVTVLAASACGSSGSSGATAQATTSAATTTFHAAQPPTPTPLPSPMPPPAGFPTGKYTGVLTSGGGVPGTLILNPDGTYNIYDGPSPNPASFDVVGNYTVSGNRIIFQETAGLCGQPGAYTWLISGSTLKFTVVDDTCAGGARGNDFGLHPWTKQP